MNWAEIDGVWSHPELGSIAQLADGKWRITYPTGERAEPDDDLAHSKLSAEAIQSGRSKDGAEKWTHPRYGSVQKRTLGWLSDSGHAAMLKPVSPQSDLFAAAA